MYIRKKTFVLMLTYLLAALIALGAYTAAHFSLESGCRRTARQGYELAFEETVLPTGSRRSCTAPAMPPAERTLRRCARIFMQAACPK